MLYANPNTENAQVNFKSRINLLVNVLKEQY